MPPSVSTVGDQSAGGGGRGSATGSGVADGTSSARRGRTGPERAAGAGRLPGVPALDGVPVGGLGSPVGGAPRRARRPREPVPARYATGETRAERRRVPQQLMPSFDPAISSVGRTIVTFSGKGANHHRRVHRVVESMGGRNRRPAPRRSRRRWSSRVRESARSWPRPTAPAHGPRCPRPRGSRPGPGFRRTFVRTPCPVLLFWLIVIVVSQVANAEPDRSTLPLPP